MVPWTPGATVKRSVLSRPGQVGMGSIGVINPGAPAPGGLVRAGKPPLICTNCGKLWELCKGRCQALNN